MTMPSIPSTAKAAVLTAAKQPLSIEERPVPQPGPEDVLIQVTSTAVNPVDWKVLDGAFPLPVPSVQGSDGAGVIVAVGDQVKDKKVGDRVFFQGAIGNSDKATFQQYTTCPAKLVGLLPDNITDDQGAGISLATLAALTELYAEEGLHIQPTPWEAGGDKAGHGKVFVILGGSSSVGQYTIQLARLSGFEVITNSSPKHFDRLKKLGAAHVLDRSSAKPADYPKAVPGRPLFAIADSISGAETQQLAVDIFQEFGKSSGDTQPKEGNIVTLVYGEQEKAIQAGKNAEYKVEFKKIMGLGHAPHLQHLSAGFHAAAGGPKGWFAEGKFEPNIPEVMPGGLNGLAEAYEKNKKGVSGVKLIVRPQETQ